MASAIDREAQFLPSPCQNKWFLFLVKTKGSFEFALYEAFSWQILYMNYFASKSMVNKSATRYIYSLTRVTRLLLTHIAIRSGTFKILLPFPLLFFHFIEQKHAISRWGSHCVPQSCGPCKALEMISSTHSWEECSADTSFLERCSYFNHCFERPSFLLDHLLIKA